jgi:hypothetical protein
MSGKLVHVIPKTTFDFTNNSAGVLPLGDPIDTLEYIEATLILRVHSLTATGSGTFYFRVYRDGWFQGTNQDFLGVVFSGTDVVGNPIVLTQSTVAPTLRLIKVKRVSSRYIIIGMEPKTAGLKVSVSVDVCLRSPDEELVLARIGENGQLELVESPAEKPCCCPKCQAPGESRSNGEHELGPMPGEQT